MELEGPQRDLHHRAKMRLVSVRHPNIKMIGLRKPDEKFSVAKIGPDDEANAFLSRCRPLNWLCGVFHHGRLLGGLARDR